MSSQVWERDSLEFSYALFSLTCLEFEKWKCSHLFFLPQAYPLSHLLFVAHGHTSRGQRFCTVFLYCKASKRTGADTLERKNQLPLPGISHRRLWQPHDFPGISAHDFLYMPGQFTLSLSPPHPLSAFFPSKYKYKYSFSGYFKLLSYYGTEKSDLQPVFTLTIYTACPRSQDVWAMVTSMYLCWVAVSCCHVTTICNRPCWLLINKVSGGN